MLTGCICLIAMLCAFGAGIYCNYRYPSQTDRINGQNPFFWFD